MLYTTLDLTYLLELLGFLVGLLIKKIFLFVSPLLLIKHLLLA